MCDAMSMFSAFTSFAGGMASNRMARAESRFIQAQAIDRRSQLDFEAAQLDAMGVMAAAAGARAEGRLRRDYTEQLRMNVAAAAISGFDIGSFSAVLDGNEKDMQRNLADIQRGVDLERSSLEAEARSTRIAANSVTSMAAFEGKMARLRGITSALAGFSEGLETLGRADRMYRQGHMAGQSRGSFFMQSLLGR